MTYLIRKARTTRGRSLPKDEGRGRVDNDASLGAKAAEPAVGRLVYDSLQWMAKQPDDAVLRTMDPDRIARSLPWGRFSFLFYETNTPIQTVIAKSARHELDVLGVIPHPLRKADDDPDTDTADDWFTSPADPSTGVSTSLTMDLINPRAVQYAEAQSARMVVSISAAMRNTIRTLTAEATGGKWSAYEMASILRTVIPLTPSWAAAVAKSYAANVDSYVQSGSSMADATRMAQNLADAYSSKLQVARAWNIARTETMQAANLGKLTGWQTGIDQGWIAEDSLKVWEEGREPCDECAPLVGQLVAVSDTFSSGVSMPPEHPSCRCTASIVPNTPERQALMAAQAATRLL